MYVLQTERSPTLGSIETTDYDKRQFAYQSLEFNIRDKQFCDLFPELLTKIQVEFDLYVKNEFLMGVSLSLGRISEKEC